MRIFCWIFDRMVPQKYIRLGVDGVWCVMEPGDACDTIKDSDNPAQYTIMQIRMTKRAFDNLHEFGGY